MDLASLHTARTLHSPLLPSLSLPSSTSSLLGPYGGLASPHLPAACTSSVLVFAIPVLGHPPQFPLHPHPGSFLLALCCLALSSTVQESHLAIQIAPVLTWDRRASAGGSQQQYSPGLHDRYLPREPPCPTAVVRGQWWSMLLAS